MKTAIKFYFKYTPVWFFIYRIVTTVVSSLIPIAYSVLIPSTVAAYFAGTVGFEKVATVICVVLIINLTYVIINKVVEYQINPKLNYNFAKGINMLLFNKMNNVSLQYYDDPKFYDKYNLAKQNTLPAVSSSANIILSIVEQTISIGTLLTMITLIDPTILLFMAGCAVIAVIIQIIEAIITLKLQKECANISHIFEYVSRTFYLKRYALDGRYTDISDINLDLYRTTTVKQEKLLRKFMKKVMPLDCLDASVRDILIYFSIVIFSCYRITVLKQYSAGELVAVLTSSLALFSRLSGIGNIISGLFDVKTHMGFFNDFMSTPENRSGKSEASKSTLSKEIVVQDLSFSYGEKEVLHGVSLKIPATSTTALIGPNGAGKSTLIKLLLGLYSEYSGTISLDGMNALDINEQSFSELFMVVNQSPVIYEMTVAENILLRSCESEDDKAAVWNILQKVGLKDKIMQYKAGIDTVIGNEFHADGIQLSGGEMQKIALARCLCHKKKVLILDEPSSNLDPISERSLFDLFASLKNELTFIIITHNIHNTVDADQIIWLENGRIEEAGTHEQLMKLGKKYATTYDSLYNTLK